MFHLQFRLQFLMEFSALVFQPPDLLLERKLRGSRSISQLLGDLFALRLVLRFRGLQLRLVLLCLFSFLWISQAKQSSKLTAADSHTSMLAGRWGRPPGTRKAEKLKQRDLQGTAPRKTATSRKGAAMYSPKNSGRRSFSALLLLGRSSR